MIYLGAIALLVIAFFLKRYIQRWLIFFARALVVISFLAALLGVFTVRPFVYLAERSLENAGTLETLKKIDAALPLVQVVTPVENLVEKIKDLWNGKTTDNTVVVERTTKTGLLEQEVYPGLVAIIASTYRGVTLGLALLGLVLSVYLNYSIVGISELEVLKKKYEQLEKKVEKLDGKEN